MAHAVAKTELMRIRIMEKQRKLVLREDANEMIDSMAGIMLTHLGGMSARCKSRPGGQAQHRRGRDADPA